MTVREAAAKFGVSTQTINRWCNHIGDFDARVNDSGRWVIADNATRPAPRQSGRKVKPKQEAQ